MKAKNTLLCGLLFTATALSAQLQETSFYSVHPANGNVPVIDGKILDDPAWKEVPAHTRYYAYLNQNPPPATVRTEFRMLYDANGIYLAIVNYGDVSKLKAVITAHDDASLWSDDSAEIYFDRQCMGTQYREFMVNSIGTLADIFQFDPQNRWSNWNALGWINKSLIVRDPGEDRSKDYWTIESFFPWDDLGGSVKPGDIWGFHHNRFSMGIWNLSASSPGGGFYNPDRFGRIYFAPDAKKLDDKTIAELISTKNAPPWCVQIGDTLWKNEKGKIESESISAKLERAEKERAAMLASVKAEITDKTAKNRLQALEKLEKAVPEKLTGLARAISLDENKVNLEMLYWDLRIDKEFN